MDTYTIETKTPQNVIRRIPHKTGIYMFRDAKDTVLYVGKAKDLQKRIRSYFEKTDLRRQIPLLMDQIASISTIPTASEFDALLLEAKLIRFYSPKYNIVARDDKSPLYVRLTLEETLPRVQFLRKNQLEKLKSESYVYGPFQSAYIIRMILRQLRTIIPYCTQKRRNGRPCFYTHILLCDPCPSVIQAMPQSSKKNTLIHIYRKNIYHLSRILAGDTHALVRDLDMQMRNYAQNKEYELAGRIRDQIQRLTMLSHHSYDPMLYIKKDAFVEDIHAIELSKLREVLERQAIAVPSLHKIECVDISNIQGVQATGSLVVCIDGQLDTSLYRKFRIKKTHTPNDVAMMKEVLSRRFTHVSWELPDLIIVDGGKPQVRVAQRVIQELGLSCMVMGLAKRNEDIILPVGSTLKTVRLDHTNPALQLIMRIRDEAHRVAVSYHRLLRQKVFV